MQSGSRVALFYDPADDSLCIGADEGEDESKWIASMDNARKGTLYFPQPDVPENNYGTARFIAKIALEVLAYKFIDVNGWNDEIVDKAELDELRYYVRLGNPNLIWPVHIRQIYSREFLFADSEEGSYQVLHEWTILNTQESEFFVVAAIFGVEYSINLGGPEIDGYLKWLKENDHRSPLYETMVPPSL